MRTGASGERHWHVSCRSFTMKLPHGTPSRAAGLVAALTAFGGLSGAAIAQTAPPPPPVAGAPAPPPPVTGAPAPPPPPPVAGAPARPPRGGPGPLGGTITAARPYHVTIRTRAGRSVELTLHNGTIINPRGTTLSPGMRVAVRGVPGPDGAVVTDEVDVRVGPPPAPGGPGPRGPRQAGPPPAAPATAPIAPAGASGAPAPPPQPPPG